MLSIIDISCHFDDPWYGDERDYRFIEALSLYHKYLVPGGKYHVDGVSEEIKDEILRQLHSDSINHDSFKAFKNLLLESILESENLSRFIEWEGTVSTINNNFMFT